jgi:hypothetical protein
VPTHQDRSLLRFIPDARRVIPEADGNKARTRLVYLISHKPRWLSTAVNPMEINHARIAKCDVCYPVYWRHDCCFMSRGKLPIHRPPKIFTVSDSSGILPLPASGH